MSQAKPIHEASFKVRIAAFPGQRWSEYRKVFKAKRSNRGTGPAWERIDGPGFTIWLSDVVLFDSRTAPPTWEIRLEALAALNPAGHQCWQEVCTGIEQFLQEQGLKLTERPFEVVVEDRKS